MSLPLTVSCSSKIQIGFTFLVPAYPGCPGKEAIKWLLLLLLCLVSILSPSLSSSESPLFLFFPILSFQSINQSIMYFLSGPSNKITAGSTGGWEQFNGDQ